MGKCGTNKVFDGKRLEVAKRLANPDFTGTITELLKTCEVPSTTFYRWMDDNDYLQYINSLIEKYTDGELSSVWKALLRKCKLGDVQAIKLYFELKGKYKQQIDLKNSGIVQIINNIPDDDNG